MSDLLRELAAAEARADQLRRRITAASCIEVGHDWKFHGGANAGCKLDAACSCSVPVYSCSKCGDCDYGDNDEAARTIRDCEAEQDA